MQIKMIIFTVLRLTVKLFNFFHFKRIQKIFFYINILPIYWQIVIGTTKCSQSTRVPLMNESVRLKLVKVITYLQTLTHTHTHSRTHKLIYWHTHELTHTFMHLYTRTHLKTCSHTHAHMYVYVWIGTL